MVGLANEDARALLHEAVLSPLDERIQDRIVAETRGNPLALLELPRGLSGTQLAGGLGLLEFPRNTLSTRLEESFQRRIDMLSNHARLLLLVGAAEPVGDPMLVWRAARKLEVETAAADTGGLLTIRESVQFRHPLVRSTVYRSAPEEERRRVHLALAEATDPDVDPDRRAWHLAAAASAPDEAVAQELERSAGRATARGGVAAAAAYLQRAFALTADQDRRGERALAAAELSFQAGAFDAVQRLLATSEFNQELDGCLSARALLLRGRVALATSYGDDAAPLLLEAARALESIDLGLARTAYLAAYGSAMFTAHLGQPGMLLEVCQAIEDLPPSHGAAMFSVLHSSSCYVTVQIPKTRTGLFLPSLLQPRRRIDQALHAVVCEAYVHGVSTRKVDDLVAAMGVESGISKSEVSRICARLDAEVAALRSRPLDHTWFPYVFLDATYLKVRLNGRVSSQAVVVATGVSIDGRREILGHAVGDSETEPFWAEFLRTLRDRGLAIASGDQFGVQLVISDAHRGLPKAIGAVLPGAAWQRSFVDMGGGGMVPLVHLRRRERTLAA